MKNRIQIGLLGAGHLGKIHAKLLKESSAFDLVGFYDQDKEVCEKVAAQFDIPAFGSAEELLGQVEAVDIVTPTPSHYGYTSQALRLGKHVFVEKPITESLKEAEQLLALSKKHPERIIQVGHVERFNPAFLTVGDQPIQPMFIEGHRLAMYNPRGTDVSVVLDLMIHDLDIVLSLVDAPVEKVSASGVAVISDSPDIANARIEFANGCVANLTASRISVKNMRRLRLFQKNTYLALDFLQKKVERFRLTEGQAPAQPHFVLDKGEETKYLLFDQPEIQTVNAILMELEEFARSIRKGDPVRVGLHDGYKALKLAYQILAEIDLRAQKANLS